MADAITGAVVELARYAVIAYAIKHGAAVLAHWIDHGRPLLRASLEEQILDAAREHNLDLGELARRLS